MFEIADRNCVYFHYKISNYVFEKWMQEFLLKMFEPLYIIVSYYPYIIYFYIVKTFSSIHITRNYFKRKGFLKSLKSIAKEHLFSRYFFLKKRYQDYLINKKNQKNILYSIQPLLFGYFIDLTIIIIIIILSLNNRRSVSLNSKS